MKKVKQSHSRILIITTIYTDINFTVNQQRMQHQKINVKQMGPDVRKRTWGIGRKKWYELTAAVHSTNVPVILVGGVQDIV